MSYVDPHRGCEGSRGGFSRITRLALKNPIKLIQIPDRIAFAVSPIKDLSSAMGGDVSIPPHPLAEKCTHLREGTDLSGSPSTMSFLPFKEPQVGRAEQDDI